MTYTIIPAIDDRDVQRTMDYMYSPAFKDLYLKEGISKYEVHDIVEVKPFRCR